MPEPLTAAELAELRRGKGLDPARLGPYEVTSRLLDTVEAREAENAALREIVAAVAASNPYGGWYPADSAPPGVVCRWCMERASSPQACQHDAECTWSRARALQGAGYL